MIRLKRLNVVKEVASEEAAQKLINRGFKRVEETTSKDTDGSKEKTKGSKNKSQKSDNGGGDNAAGTGSQDNNGGKSES